MSILLVNKGEFKVWDLTWVSSCRVQEKVKTGTDVTAGWSVRVMAPKVGHQVYSAQCEVQVPYEVAKTPEQAVDYAISRPEVIRDVKIQYLGQRVVQSFEKAPVTAAFRSNAHKYLTEKYGENYLEKSIKGQNAALKILKNRRVPTT